jgi:hypothetical protein
MIRTVREIVHNNLPLKEAYDMFDTLSREKETMFA